MFAFWDILTGNAKFHLESRCAGLVGLAAKPGAAFGKGDVGPAETVDHLRGGSPCHQRLND